MALPSTQTDRLKEDWIFKHEMHNKRKEDTMLKHKVHYRLSKMRHTIELLGNIPH